VTSGGNKFKDFPENQMTKFHAEFPILCRIWSWTSDRRCAVAKLGVLGGVKYHCSVTGVFKRIWPSAVLARVVWHAILLS